MPMTSASLVNGSKKKWLEKQEGGQLIIQAHDLVAECLDDLCQLQYDCAKVESTQDRHESMIELLSNTEWSNL